MDPQRYQQIGELYFARLARQGDRRDAFLRVACAGDEDLRREVALLLEAAQQAVDDFLKSAPPLVSASHIVDQAEKPSARPHPGRLRGADAGTDPPDDQTLI